MTERQRPTEQTGARIRRLKADLDSEIVVQEEIAHIEPAHTEKMNLNPNNVQSFDPGITGWDPAAGDSWVPDVTIPERKVIDQPRIAEPNTEIRLAAREELLQIYESTPTFKVKWQSGRALSYSRFRILRERLLS